MDYQTNSNLQQIKALKNAKIKTDDNQKLLNSRKSQVNKELKRLHNMYDHLTLQSTKDHIAGVIAEIESRLED